ncbi:hypothetical protein EMIHUDRAFT_447753 [Emiliania huxleyi CCMP1516]|uniref:Uncharacterized protein n=2 Tax=Emiliania huxleyi TaxID=2903 RepID=A0A0D3JHI5_EMIH1|nr:hypothetical protein EMIHUDRAFT_447753 [Emiliania huxleyi CCMP1516]EOD22970.1 hypothetical protein EMIHUDRAFT_447753 [Emiliania huxleyi CCMP1516]|eukprot:XP_005775399.1 hypothetical protein EMIHUDRAFT_447753 [Emiliania huxleyi CCMP1516]
MRAGTKHERHRGARLCRVRAALRDHTRDGVGVSVALPPCSDYGAVLRGWPQGTRNTAG